MSVKGSSSKKKSVKALSGRFRPALASSALISLALLFVSATFYPAPVHAAAESSVSPQSGPVGSTVVIRGQDFSGQLATIHWDEEVMAEEVPVSQDGTLSYELTVPHAVKGEHVIFISDDSNWSESTATVSFEVLPSIRVSPHQSEPQTQITVTGHGFGNLETDINITLDDTVVTSTFTSANNVGTWNIVYNLPDIPRGEHMFGAQGNATYASEVAKVPFIVTPWSKIEPASGEVGTEAIVRGYGFKTGEVGISISWDDEVIASGLNADTEGNIEKPITVPASFYGKHAIGMFGKVYTLKGKVPKTYFEVLPSLTLETDTAATGEKITIRGTGFNAKDKLILTFDGDEVAPPLRSDELGSFRTNFTVPQTAASKHTIAVSDSKNNTAEAALTTVKFAASAAPNSVSPPNDEIMAVFNSIGRVYIAGFKYLIGSSPLGMSGTDFVWSLKNETGEERYILQIARGTSFAQPVLERETEGSTSYRLSEDEALPPGKYSWRVKVIDTMGRESNWSDVSSFQVILIPLYIAILSGVLLLLFIAAVILGIRVAYVSQYR